MQCIKCGVDNPAGNTFCGKCGASISPVPAPIPDPVYIATSRATAPGCLAIFLVMMGCIFGIAIVSVLDGAVGTYPFITWGMVILSALAVYYDANSLGVRKGLISGIFDMGPLGWAFATFLLWVIAFPAYIVARPLYADLLKNRR
jgi:hypothetical protein